MKFPMKSSPLILLALTGALSVAGCGAPSAQTAPAETNADLATANAAPLADGTVADAAANSAMTGTTNSAMAKTGAAMADAPAAPQNADATGAPAPTYRVVDPAELDGAPPAYVEAMKKVRVSPPPASMKLPDKVTVKMQTNRGPITLELDSKAAPLQVKSFVYLANKGFFDGTVFHRHAALMGGDQGYIIQGGDPLTKDPANEDYYGQGGPGYQIPRERNNLTHQKLVIAAARSQDPDSAGSQFYITQAAVPFLDENEGYTVFGKVVAGEAAALKLTQGDKIEKVTVTDPKAAR